MAKLQFKDKTCQEPVNLSEEVKEMLLQCHAVHSDLIVTFHQEFVRLLDGNLELKSQVSWKDQLPGMDPKL